MNKCNNIQDSVLFALKMSSFGIKDWEMLDKRRKKQKRCNFNHIVNGCNFTITFFICIFIFYKVHGNKFLIEQSGELERSVNHLTYSKMKIQIILLIAAFFMISQLSAQEVPKVRFGKVSEEELKMTVYEPDTAAAAVILFDEGQSELKYDVGKKKFILGYDRFLRIKILKQSGTSWGNFTIPLYSSGLLKEELSSVDGVSFNMEADKMVKTELKKEAVFQERENKTTEITRLSLPALKVGSVFDLRYRISSPLYWNLRTWKFQYSIPVRWSQYEVIYPEYFKYNHSSLGYHPLNSQNQSTRNESINYTATTTTAGSILTGGGQSEKQLMKISYATSIYDYTAKDVPALKPEPYMTTPENFTTRMKFELASIDFSKTGGEYRNYTNSWASLANQLLDEEEFGGQLNSSDFVDEFVRDLIAGKATEMEKALAVYSHLQQNMKWNNTQSLFTSKSLKKVWNEKTGNSAELNLLLLLMLREAGLSADPVILSTREHGLISPVHASLSECNYVLVKATIDNKPMFLDVTDPVLQAGLLPFRCLNGKGILIRKGFPEELGITNPSSVSSTSVTLGMKEGKLSGDIRSHLSGLNAFNFRQAVKKAGGEQAHFETVKNNTEGIAYTGYTYKNLDSLYLMPEKKYSIVFENDPDDAPSILYINPIVGGRMQKNLFTSSSRMYPVDFGVPWSETYRLNLGIPEGYKVEELPKSKSIQLGEKDGKFSYTIGQMDNRIALNLRFSIDKPLFLPSEYEKLKEFLDLVVAKESEQIVLKKISTP